MCIFLGVAVEEFTAVPMQGSGTFAIESVLQTAVPRQGGKVRKDSAIMNPRYMYLISSAQTDHVVSRYHISEDKVGIGTIKCKFLFQTSGKHVHEMYTPLNPTFI